MTRPRKIAIANQKGGTGKTTTAVNLSAGLARQGHRVLLIDIDPQANATFVLLNNFILIETSEHTIYEVMIHEAEINTAIQRIALETNKYHPLEAVLYLLPSHVRLAKSGMELPHLPNHSHRLLSALKGIENNYDYIIFDCPPALGLLTINALIAANEVIIPVEPGIFSMVGIGLLQQTIHDLTVVNHSLKLLGVLPTLTDHTVESRETTETLAKMFPNHLLPSIPKRVAIKEAHSSGMDIFSYDPKNDAASAYAALVKEVENG